jgi:hypothetical protein
MIFLTLLGNIGFIFVANTGRPDVPHQKSFDKRHGLTPHLRDRDSLPVSNYLLRPFFGTTWAYQETCPELQLLMKRPRKGMT